MPEIIYIGRFQPFHLGHLSVLQFLAENYSKVHIVIGSANKSYERENPFTFIERVEMIGESVGELLPGKVAISGVPDMPDTYEWGVDVVKRAPTAKVVACARTHHPLFRDLGLEAIATPKFKRDDYRGTNIRTAMIQFGHEDAWTLLVPKGTAVVLSRIGGIDRMRGIAEVD